MKYLNLKQIVRQTHEAELDMNYTEDRFKKLYDNDNARLLEVLSALNFCVDLIKEDGEYHIPQEDGEFIQWILEHYTDADMKLIRKGEYIKADLQYVFFIITGLDNMMKHLEVDEDIHDLQMEYIHKKTDYYVQVRIWNTQVELYRMFNDVANYMKQPTFNLTYENRIEYLDTVNDLTEAYVRSVREAFSDVWKRRKAEVRSHSFPITLEELAFSERSIQISNELSENEEYVSLRRELREMKRNKGFLNKYEKERDKKEKRLLEIFREVASKYPIEVDKMTKIERIMCLAESTFLTQYDSETKEWTITFDVDDTAWEQIDSLIVE